VATGRYASCIRRSGAHPGDGPRTRSSGPTGGRAAPRFAGLATDVHRPLQNVAMAALRSAQSDLLRDRGACVSASRAPVRGASFSSGVRPIADPDPTHVAREVDRSAVPRCPRQLRGEIGPRRFLRTAPAAAAIVPGRAVPVFVGRNHRRGLATRTRCNSRSATTARPAASSGGASVTPAAVSMDSSGVHTRADRRVHTRSTPRQRRARVGTPRRRSFR
jgi:hypothetical protein